jgi:hypothetical protein
MYKTILCVCVCVCLAVASCDESVAPTPIPAPPEDVRLQVRTAEIEITWRDASANEELFLVEVAIGNGSFVTFAQVGANTTRAVYPNPQAGAEFRFRVSACNRTGCSAVQERATDTNSLLPLSLDDVSATAMSPTTLRIALSGTHRRQSVDLEVVVRGVGNPYSQRITEGIRPSATSLDDQFNRSYTFEGLTEGSSYAYEVVMRGASTASTAMFTRQGTVVPAFTKPLIVGIVGMDASPTSLNVNITVRPGPTPTDVTMEFAVADAAFPPPTTVAKIPADALNRTVVVTVPLTGLRAGVTYSARFAATNLAGRASATIQFSVD